MKTINWESCKTPGVFSNTLLKNGRLPLPTDPVKPNMKVHAKYKGCGIFLKIIEETTPDIFKASVTNIRSSGKERPNDLSLDDEVSIDREHICTLFID
jgi:hypothetical protein